MDSAAPDRIPIIQEKPGFFNTGFISKASIRLPVLSGRTVHVPAEHSVEIADVAVAAVHGHGRDRGRALPQQVAGHAHPVLVQVLRGRHVDPGLEQAAELPFAHVEAAGQLRQGDRAAVVFLHELEDLLDDQRLRIPVPGTGGQGRGGILAEEMPGLQEGRFDQQLPSRDARQAQAAQLLQRRVQRLPGLLPGPEVVAEHQSARGLAQDVFLLDVVIAAAAYQLPAEHHGIEA